MVPRKSQRSTPRVLISTTTPTFVQGNTALLYLAGRGLRSVMVPVSFRFVSPVTTWLRPDYAP